MDKSQSTPKPDGSKSDSKAIREDFLPPAPYSADEDIQTPHPLAEVFLKPIALPYTWADGEDVFITGFREELEKVMDDYRYLSILPKEGFEPYKGNPSWTPSDVKQVALDDCHAYIIILHEMQCDLRVLQITKGWNLQDIVYEVFDAIREIETDRTSIITGEGLSPEVKNELLNRSGRRRKPGRPRKEEQLPNQATVVNIFLALQAPLKLTMQKTELAEGIGIIMGQADSSYRIALSKNVIKRNISKAVEILKEAADWLEKKRTN